MPTHHYSYLQKYLRIITMHITVGDAFYSLQAARIAITTLTVNIDDGERGKDDIYYCGVV
jgi:hypothetical protein